MQIFPLLYFKTIAETNHLTRAAEQLCISPPALSNALKRLEQDLGVPLFDRVGRNLVLNSYGEAYLPYAKKILALTEQGNELLQDMRLEGEKHLSVADMTHVFASHVISEFLGQHPEIRLRRAYVDPSDSSAIDLLRNFDFVIGSTNGLERRDLCGISLRFGDQIVAVMNRNHALAKKKTVPVEQLLNVPMIAYGAGMPGRKMLDMIFKPLGKKPMIIYEGNSPHAMVPALERNLGVFLQPTPTANFNMPFYEDCVAIPVENCVYHSNTSLLWDPARKQTEAAKLFCRFCENYCNGVSVQNSD